ncbi:MAG TPA: LUD domain-containing protein, partial [Spirochaetota bacterium]
MQNNNFEIDGIAKVVRNLNANLFDSYIASDIDEADRILHDTIIPSINPQSIAWGGSVTVEHFLPRIRAYGESKTIIDTREQGVPWPDLVERRRQALLVDLFLTGTNAITEQGTLVNLDATGNRVGGLTFGPRFVVVIAGRNKI